MTQQRKFEVSPVERNIGLNAGRIRKEKQADGRGWSLADVCRQLEKRDRTINLDAASLKRIEEGKQRIRYSEAIALSKVFGVDLEVMRLPPELAAVDGIRALVRQWGDATRAWNAHVKGERALYAKVEEAEARMVEALPDDEASREHVIAELASVRRALYGTDHDDNKQWARNFYSWKKGVVDDAWMDRLDRDEGTPRDIALRDYINEGGEFPDVDA
ncbi:helix-turn-helix domain-containing protein [Demequina silvatica]|uniref:helix-turn-helix domain-containing protein n=1 Tax=Demequina silvatica TaxID=1638988 RepID=UPI000782A0EA|nr:helix-turn-helix transcriptional regulator [Demequina silvatica]